MSALTVLVLEAGRAPGRDRRDAVEHLAKAKESAVDRGHGAHAQGVALAAPYGHAQVERGSLGESVVRQLPLEFAGGGEGLDH
ncbi:hypothetical protein ACFYPT_35875 [Streptomyces sp. NPDC005529]|uniref:hypothetical protein n=1 Tax=unclassified Streptomyces TaxID=2593676 RepID=UPI0033A69321